MKSLWFFVFLVFYRRQSTQKPPRKGRWRQHARTGWGLGEKIMPDFFLHHKVFLNHILYLLLSRGISKTNILYITCQIVTGLLIPYFNCTPRFIESSMNPGLGISIHTYVFDHFMFYVVHTLTPPASQKEFILACSSMQLSCTWTR